MTMDSEIGLRVHVHLRHAELGQSKAVSRL